MARYEHILNKGDNMNIRKIKVQELFDNIGLQRLSDEYEREAKIEGLPDVKLDYDMYTKQDALGFLDTVCLFDRGVIVGVISAITVKMPHYTELGTTIESYYILPEYRKNNMGKKLLKHLENVVKLKGSKFLFMSAPIGGRLQVAARGLGFKATNITHKKDL